MLPFGQSWQLWWDKNEEAKALQSTAMHSCHVAAAFVQHKVFNTVEG